MAVECDLLFRSLLAQLEVEDPSHRAGRGLAAAIFGKHPCLAMLGHATHVTHVMPALRMVKSSLARQLT